MIGERFPNKEEVRRARELQARVLPSEDKAYGYFPLAIQAKVVRNIPVAFINHKAFYPDFLLCDEKILIEIDDWQHNYQPRKSMDEHRDQVFKEHGFITIRIKDKELKDKKIFLKCLYEELRKVQHTLGRDTIRMLMTEFNHMIN